MFCPPPPALCLSVDYHRLTSRAGKFGARRRRARQRLYGLSAVGCVIMCCNGGWLRVCGISREMTWLADHMVGVLV